ncbi:MAG TPA: lipid A biosynthesis lauroyl acyltransferase, partial [Pseudolabrys sp.]|nr:lipid A biosynthesis lauroyl acyltransferase [Pseudolabrys sp.]
MSKFKRRLRRGAKRASDAVVGATAIGVLKALRALDPNGTANAAGWLTRSIGPLLPEHRIGRANLKAAFPEKSPEEIETILRGVWDNLGRVGAEFAQLDRLWDFDPAQPERKGRIELSSDNIKRFEQLLYDGKPALIFAAHLANW